jgi:peptidoglycan/xylan/chitin deacetylase (PgdA/CDA1 family)
MRPSGNSGKFLLTFDDGYREMAEVVVPILEKRSVPAVFFVNPAFIDNRRMSYRNKASLIIERIEKDLHSSELKQISNVLNLHKPAPAELKKTVFSVSYPEIQKLDEIARILEIDFDLYLKEQKPFMTTDQISSIIKKGFAIGSHSMDHPRFQDISFEDQVLQVKRSFDELEQKFHLDLRAFAFPFHDRGITKEFFNYSSDKGLVDVSFGTSGFQIGHAINNFQRQPMEGWSFHAMKIYRVMLTESIIRNMWLDKVS